ncbi:Crp/Fnr family transcriptional regulator [Curvibacter sp. HBC28]|jgi:CRP/FNR family cyclic AMP-dependent transcriptional regulator|uniref:Crp/Fnr family transcriptional regulator n=1 Tax=Curvibacter microcysteis TaxID=3026419 RepID=A0ABT5MK28_9BURK|nr:Crp/Fnr family transcriptional regulator [Curvibacter sp. HBC28]MDD0816242.1 Crp/Fnr family transcriptional regulator [Curvibacter sp. HBC28]
MLFVKDSPSEVAVRRLKVCRLFAGMDESKLSEVARQCSWQQLHTGHIATGRSQDTFFIVCQGKMRVSALSPNGRELLIADFEQGGHFGVIGVLGASAASLQAHALEPSLLACLQRADFMRLVHENVPLAGLVRESLQIAAEQLMSRLVELGVLNIAGRLYSCLLEMARQAGVVDNRAVITPAPLRAELATRIAASREEVSRELARLRKLGLITSTRQRIVLNDVAALELRLQNL